MEKYYPDDFRQKTVEKISTEVASYITEQIESAINEEQQKSMETIEERAKDYVGHPEEIDEFSSATIRRMAYIIGAKEQREITLKAFDEWLCRNSWITGDEGNRKPLKELRNIIRNI